MGPARFGEVFDALAPDDAPGASPAGTHLDEVALAVSSTLQPGLDEQTWITELDRVAAGCPGSGSDAVGIARYLADEVGLTGDRATYDDWRNSCLDQVLVRRVGIPITLSIVLIEVGRRCGVELVGVGMPAHFLVGDPAGDRYFDLFNGPDPLDAAQVRALFHSMVGAGHPWSDTYLRATPPRGIVIRMLNNLMAGFRARGDAVRLGLVMAMRAQIDELATTEGDAIAAAVAVFN